MDTYAYKDEKIIVCRCFLVSDVLENQDIYMIEKGNFSLVIFTAGQHTSRAIKRSVIGIYLVRDLTAEALRICMTKLD